MSRLAPYAGIILALFTGVLLVVFSNNIAPTPDVPAATPPASSTVSAVPGPAAPSVDASPQATTATPATSMPKKTVNPPAKAAVTPSAQAAIPVVQEPAPAAPASSGSASLDAAAGALRGALVNIMCYSPVGGGLHSISGSGVFIDAKGVILTNAHVAQYFLLTDRGVSCTIRSGSPAADKYKAALIYVSPAWLHANASVLTQAAPSGTGEYDFALLAVTKSATAEALPAAFPFLPLAQLPPPSGTPVVIASFGAQFLETSQIQSSLFPTIVFGSVKDVFTFGVNTIDELSLGGSAAAQEGSSGGGIANAAGALVGTITTSTVQGATDTRSLGAITASYIRSEYARETGSTLDFLLSEPIAASVADFSSQIPALESILTANL